MSEDKRIQRGCGGIRAGALIMQRPRGSEGLCYWPASEGSEHQDKGREVAGSSLWLQQGEQGEVEGRITWDKHCGGITLSLSRDNNFH